MNFQNADFTASYGTFQQLPESKCPEFAFSGRSNVGKSSLINKLFGRRSLARVSSSPGKTATANFYHLKSDGKEAAFVDLPGYGYAKVAASEKKRWNDLVGGYLSDSSRNLALVFQLIDFRHPPTADDLNMINFFIDSEIPFIVVLTKADKLNKTERAKRLEALNDELPCADGLTVIPFSTLSGEGVDAIQQIIMEILT